MRMCQPHTGTRSATRSSTKRPCHDHEPARHQRVVVDLCRLTPVDLVGKLLHGEFAGRGDPFAEALDITGLAGMAPEFGCPICRLNENRTPDGACACGQPGCPKNAPGSVPPFETWLTGPTGCVTAARQHMVDQGWISS